MIVSHAMLGLMVLCALMGAGISGLYASYQISLLAREIRELGNMLDRCEDQLWEMDHL